MHNCLGLLEALVPVTVRKNFASFSPNQLTKQSQWITESNPRRLNCLMGKFVGLDRLLFQLFGIAKLVRQIGIKLFTLRLLFLKRF
jgi:hypothetical protein